MKRLKLKDSVNLEELASKYNMEYDSDNDYESGWSYAQYDRDGVFIDTSTKKISGVDNTSLFLIYELIKEDLVEEVN